MYDNIPQFTLHKVVRLFIEVELNARPLAFYLAASSHSGKNAVLAKTFPARESHIFFGKFQALKQDIKRITLLY